MKIHILHVEDNDSEAYIFRENMENLPFARGLWELFRVSDGMEAKKFLTRQTPYENAPRINLVISDYNMPNMSGFELLYDMKHSKEWTNGRPIIVIMTGWHFTRKEVQDIYALGAATFVDKPKNMEEFQRIMRYWLLSARFPS